MTVQFSEFVSSHSLCDISPSQVMGRILFIAAATLVLVTLLGYSKTNTSLVLVFL